MVCFDDFKIDLSGFLALARKTGKMEFDGGFLFDGILRYVRWNYRHIHFGGKDEILQIATKNALDTFVMHPTSKDGGLSQPTRFRAVRGSSG